MSGNSFISPFRVNAAKGDFSRITENRQRGLFRDLRRGQNERPLLRQKAENGPLCETALLSCSLVRLAAHKIGFQFSQLVNSASVLFGFGII